MLLALQGGRAEISQLGRGLIRSDAVGILISNASVQLARTVVQASCTTDRTDTCNDVYPDHWRLPVTCEDIAGQHCQIVGLLQRPMLML